MGGIFSSSRRRGDEGEDKGEDEFETALSKAKKLVSSTPVVIFSKTYCVYCQRVKKLLSQLGASHKVIELDVERDGGEIQSALAEWAGQRTVPNVFIGGNHIGGCDMVMAKHKEGKLLSLLTDAGAIGNKSSHM
ncbi:PREDICTED: glutaredoxin-like [Nelumbo nucifera]|uniref:Glutaredoxin-like n=1 Tax=Nelumbo nucifera TaxID=4432 RepID=A0A1U7ZEE2_NELNU|nr:PREDICTED: glutaredoxin-like [Nelumbo nucifera]